MEARLRPSFTSTEKFIFTKVAEKLSQFKGKKHCPSSHNNYTDPLQKLGHSQSKHQNINIYGQGSLASSIEGYKIYDYKAMITCHLANSVIWRIYLPTVLAQVSIYAL